MLSNNKVILIKVKHCDYFRTAIKLVNKVQRDQSEEGSHSLIAQYLRLPQVDIKDIYGMAVDMILAGIDTVSSFRNAAHKLMKPLLRQNHS